MVKTIDDRLSEFENDLDDLFHNTDTTQNTVWGNQLRALLQSTNISTEDLKDFEKTFNNMVYSSQLTPYRTMKMFIKLLRRQNLSEKKEKNSSNIPTVKPIKVNPTRRIQSLEGFPKIEYVNPKKPSISDSLKTRIGMTAKPTSNKIFIVHGLDEITKLTLESMLREMGLEPIILHKQANKGKTIIEKFEEHADEVSFAFVLFTPDDMGGKLEDSKKMQPRARQNVILEFGYFIAKLGRNRVCCLYKEGVELPTDMQGLVYVKFSKTPEDNYKQIRQELQAAGYDLK